MSRPPADSGARRQRRSRRPDDAASDATPDYARKDPVRRAVAFEKDRLDDCAVSVVRKLQNNGHDAYLVGGCVRDLLADLKPKDFDVATDAWPNRVKRLFRSARVIGRRFRLAHVHFPEGHIIETATFRGDPKFRSLPEPTLPRADAPTQGKRKDWRQSTENIFGTAAEDAHRRDFTINALFYDPSAGEVLDWVGGLEDMDQGVVRAIGDPAERLREDPVRMLRAVHFAKRLDFTLDPALDAAIRDEAAEIANASNARLYIELIKMLCRGKAHTTFEALHEMGVMHPWLPELCELLDETTAPEDADPDEAAYEALLVPRATWDLLHAADRYGMRKHKGSDALALATLFGPWLLRTWRRTGREGYHAFLDHMEAVFRPVAVRMSVPRATGQRMREILWLLPQLRHPPGKPKSQERIVRRPAFAEALRFLALDLDARGADTEVLDDWRELAEDVGVDPDAIRPPRTPNKRGGRGSSDRGGSGGRGRRRGGRGRGRSRGRGGGGRRGRGGREGGSGTGPEAGAWTPPPPAR